jgi:hypothetical protein
LRATHTDVIVDGVNRHLRRLSVGVAAAVAAMFGWAGIANAGVALEPVSGSTTSSRPTFKVYLEPSEQLGATVYVAPDMSMGAYFIPTRLLGSCLPAIPTGEQYTFTCQPSAYFTSGFGASLPPGTYYWWLTFVHQDTDSLVPTLHISGPLVFTVPAPTPPANAGLVSPGDGAIVSTSVTLSVRAPAGATLRTYASLGPERFPDGSPAGLTAFSCSGLVDHDDTYTCAPGNPYSVLPGETYYWWALITVGDATWIYGPRTFSTAQPQPPPTPPPPPQAPPPPPNSGGAGGGSRSHTLADANGLPSSPHFTGRSIKQTRLTKASYALSKLLGTPKTIAVACWSQSDWPSVSGDRGDGIYSTLAFFLQTMPHWIHLSPQVCRSIETLLYHRPRYPNAILANGVETVTHEMMHALGVNREAKAECFGMQLSIIMAAELGIPARYNERLARLNLENYTRRPPNYIDRLDCREDGRWDIFRHRPSPPWHNLGGL